MTIPQVFALCLKQGDTCFDVGANIGMSAEAISPLVGSSGRCVSFECHPVHFARLAFLASRPPFENVLPYCRALSDRPGHILLFTGSDPAASQASTIIPELGNSQRLGRAIARIKVETDTIDRFCAAHELSPHVIKVDVEGAEAAVFAGARAILQKNLPHVIFEFGYGFDQGQTPAHFTLLRELGYDFFVVDLNHLGGRPFTLQGEEPVLFSITTADIARTRSGGNILALHRSKSAALLAGVEVLAFSQTEPHLTPA
jgi:FkbM family methyltransferase